jgi:hypothetical protein
MVDCDTVQVDGSALVRSGVPLFLNGINLGWIDWGTDFDGSAAHGHGLGTYCGWEDALRFIASNGGNAVRVWLFTEVERSLRWRDGLVVGLGSGVLQMAHTLLELAQVAVGGWL